MKKLRRLFFTSSLIIVFVPLLAQQPEIFSTEDGAIRGYDPVAYFKEGKAVKGKKELGVTWGDAKWSFSTQENLEAFKSNPAKYAPQYGGYCAYGTSEGHKAPTQPDAWSIVNGKLYLNYNKDVQSDWKKNQSELIEKANRNWPKVKKE